MQKKHAGKKLPTYCVYGIRNLRTGHIYVSGSISAGKAFKQENSFLQRGTHKCQMLQEAYSQEGSEGFVFEVLQSVSRSKVETLPVLAQKWMRRLLKDDSGCLYNPQDLTDDLELERSTPKIYEQPKRSNPSPVRTEKVKKNMFQAVSELPSETLAKKAVYVTLGQSVYDYLHSLPQSDRINLMRSAITEAVRKRQEDNAV